MSYEYEKYIKQPTASYPAITPTASAQTADVTEYASVTVNAMPTGSATTPATTITTQPTISVNASGLITATNSKTQSVTPTVSAGYVASGTAGTITVDGSNTQQLSTQAAATITPTTSAQTAVASNVYTTGAVTVAAIQTETKTVTENGTVTPTSGKYLSSVTVNVASTPTQTKSMTLGAAAPATVTPDSGYALSSVSPSIDTSVIKAENIAEGVTMLGITGTHSGGGGVETCTFTASGRSVYIVYIDTDGNAVNTTLSSGATTTMRKVPFVASTIDTDTFGSIVGAKGYQAVLLEYVRVVGIEAADYISNKFRYYVPTANSITFYISCFLPDTLITLADGTRKAIKNLTYSDRLRVWNFDEGKFDTADICWLTKSGFHNNHYYKLTFSDGTVLCPTGQNSNHKLYSVDDRYFKGVNIIEVGERIFSENGIVIVTAKEYIEEDVEYYNLITSKTINCFANGILASDRYGNLYDIDENMKYIKEERPVRPYSEFAAVGISEYWYEPLRLSEGTQTVEEVKDYIAKLESQMLPLPEDADD